MADLRDQLQQTLGDHYTLERELGGGGMSRVFVASETALGRTVVIKVVAGGLLEGLSADRFTREVRLAARLQQANIVPLLSAGDANGVPYYTMPFVDGLSLRARLASGGVLPLAEAVNILRDVAKALAYAHAQGVVHRDIKPENVLLSGGTAMVTDFGIAKALTASRTQDGSDVHASGALTSVGTSLGTPAYMAPEQAVGSAVDLRADLYAWGVMAYELLSGAHPFADRTTAAKLVAAHIAETPAPIATKNAALPPALASVVMRSLEKDPENRPSSAGEIVAALDSVVTPGESTFGRARPDASRRERTRTIGIAATIAIVLFAAGAVWWSKRSAARPQAAGEMTLAVLPIENLGGDSTAEYLADGMTGELSSALKKVPGLQVAGDLSTFRFKGKRTDPAEIARQLGVRMLLTGRLTPGKGRVRLQMQLSNPDGNQLWSKTYTTDAKDNFAMEDEITAAIASEMRVVLSPQTLAATRAGRTENPEAHDLFMRGVFEKNKITPQALTRAITYFGDALKLDPHYAQAHAGMAFAYDMLADVYRPSHEYHTLSLAAARKAVESDSLLAEAHALLGYELASANWDFPAGRAEMQRGLALNPNSPDVVFNCGLFAWITGDTSRSVALADRLIQLDPLSPLAARLKADALQWGGRQQEALEQDKIATKLDPTVVLFESTKGTALRELGRFDESVQAFHDYEKLFDMPSWGLAMTYGRMGKRDDVLRIIHTFEERSKTEWVDPIFFAMAYAGMGDRDHAMEWIEKAVSIKSFTIRALMEWDSPWLRAVRDDPRYIALRQKVLATTFKS